MMNKMAKVAATLVLAVSAGVAAHAQSVLHVIPLKGVPDGIGVNYLTNHIYVAIPSTDESYDYLSIINGAKDTVVTTLKIPAVAQNVAVDLVRNLVYVGGSYTDKNGNQQNQVVVIDGKLKKQKALIKVSTTTGLGIEGLAVDPFTGDLYISDASDDTIDIVRKGHTKVGVEIPVAQDPYGIAVNPYTSQAYVALSNGTVDVIDTLTNTITTSTSIGGTNAGVAVNVATGNVFVTNNAFGISTTGVLDRNGNVLADIPVGDTPFGIDVDLVSDLAFVANTQDGTISEINGSTNTNVNTIPVTGNYLGVNPVTSKVYVGGQDNSVTVLGETSPI